LKKEDAEENGLEPYFELKIQKANFLFQDSKNENQKHLFL